jgi:hypothetical protein|tara:strand:+ start:524 stop:937 length:414 start_codon:yes stop_codon:yes gene_type:complete
MQYILYFLIFLFGYVTCKTFYFLRANRISLSLIKLGQIVHLSNTLKCVENLVYTRERLREYYLNMDKDSVQISSMEIKFNNDINNLKHNSIEHMLKLHPEFYREALKFHDWQSSMEFLTENKQLVFDFWRKYDDKEN